MTFSSGDITAQNFFRGAAAVAYAVFEIAIFIERGLALHAQISCGKVRPFAARPAGIQMNGNLQRMKMDERHGIKERMMTQ